MRVRLTVIVAVVAAILVLSAATIGVGRLEESLIDDVMDEAAADQLGFLDFVLLADGGVPAGPFLDAELELLEATLVELEDEDELHELFEAADVGSDEQLPVLTNLGVLVLVDDDGAVQLTGAGVETFDGPLVAEYTVEVVAAALFEPSVAEIIGVGPADLVPEVFEAFDDEDDDEHDDDVSLRYRRYPVDGLEFVIAGDVTDVVRSVDRVRGVLWIVGPALVVVAALVTWFLAGRALRPVQRITDQVDAISAGTLHERVPEPGTGDEIDALAATMNRMLDRLEVDDRRLRRFVSDASHELRTPVAVLRSEAEVALRRDPEDEVRRFAEGVLDESGRLQRIVEDLLVLARGEERQGTAAGRVLDLDDIVFAEAARRRRVAVDTQAVSAGQVRGSVEAGTRIVAHLLDNAARHATARVAVGLGTDGDSVVLTVDDDGPGVPEADRARIFERFTRLEEARTRDGGGAGLGLAVVAETTRALGGTVEIDRSDLGGARFTVSLPSAAAEGDV